MAVPEITIEVFADTQGAARCKSCHRKIVWAIVVESRAKMPFDADKWAVISTRSEEGRIVLRVDRQTNHWATCPGAKLFKAGNRGGGKTDALKGRSEPT